MTSASNKPLLTIKGLTAMAGELEILKGIDLEVFPGGDTLGNNCAAGVLAFVNHLGAGVGLLIVID